MFVKKKAFHPDLSPLAFLWVLCVFRAPKSEKPKFQRKHLLRRLAHSHFFVFCSYCGVWIPPGYRTLCHLNDFLVLCGVHVYPWLLRRIHLQPMLCACYFVVTREMEVPSVVSYLRRFLLVMYLCTKLRLHNEVRSNSEMTYKVAKQTRNYFWYSIETRLYS